MSDEIKTLRTDAAICKYPEGIIAKFNGKSFVHAEKCAELERELIIAQARIRELEVLAAPRTHRTCTACQRLLPTYLFPKLHGNELICSECYFPCGDKKC